MAFYSIYANNYAIWYFSVIFKEYIYWAQAIFKYCVKLEDERKSLKIMLAMGSALKDFII